MIVFHVPMWTSLSSHKTRAIGRVPSHLLTFILPWHVLTGNSRQEHKLCAKKGMFSCERDVLLWKGCSSEKGKFFWESDVFSEKGMFPWETDVYPEKRMFSWERDVFTGNGCSPGNGMFSWERDILLRNGCSCGKGMFSWEKGCFFWERDALLGRDGLLCEFTCQTKLTTEKYEPQFPLQCNSQQSFGRRQDAMCDDLFTTA